MTSSVDSEKKPEVPSQDVRRPSTFSVLGWVLGAMSLLNLVQDIGRMAVFGKLKVWLDAYVLVIKQVGGFLFGWIKFYWLGVSELEYHALVIAYIIGAAVLRAEYHKDRRDSPNDHPLLSLFGVGVMTLLVWGLVPLALAVLLPDYWGVGACTLAISFFGLIWLTNSEDNRHIASGKSVLRELVGVAGAFLVLVALNYSVFRTDGG